MTEGQGSGWKGDVKGTKEFRAGISVPKKLIESYKFWKFKRKEQASIEDEKTTTPDKDEPKKDSRESKDKEEKVE